MDVLPAAAALLVLVALLVMAGVLGWATAVAWTAQSYAGRGAGPGAAPIDLVARRAARL